MQIFVIAFVRSAPSSTLTSLVLSSPLQISPQCFYQYTFSPYKHGLLKTWSQVIKTWRLGLGVYLVPSDTVYVML